jgi:hypothetical protein
MPKHYCSWVKHPIHLVCMLWHTCQGVPGLENGSRTLEGPTSCYMHKSLLPTGTQVCACTHDHCCNLITNLWG